MAILNQFQQYSQKENTITNNILLMFSNLYEINPRYYEELINCLTEDSNSYQVTPDFRQQVGNKGGGIIDGFVQVKATKIIIETKRSGVENIDKLLKYCRSFDKGEYSLLFHLSSEYYPSEVKEQIEREIENLRDVGKVSFFSLTYNDIIGQLNLIADAYQYEYQLQRLSENFEDYCKEMGLIPESSHTLRAMACGQSFDLNVKHQLYFDLASRGYRPFNYLGVYKRKSIQYIAEVENMIVADWDESGGLNIIECATDVTPEQEIRLVQAIQEALELGWGVDYGHRFFLLKNFEQTDYKKTSSGGIYRVRYFDLEEEFNQVPANMEDLAQELKDKTWK